MKIIYSICFLFLVAVTPFYAFGFQNVTQQDTMQVDQLNAQAFKLRQTDADQTIEIATRALNLAKKMGYATGMAESYRTIGIGYSYQYDQVKAFDYYLNALSQYQQSNNKTGEAKVYNNIGNLYRDNDNETALKYFKKADNLVSNLNQPSLQASIYLNEGSVYLRKGMYYNALFLLDKARITFEKLGDEANLVIAEQNTGVAYFKLKKFDTAKDLLMQAHDSAVKLEMSSSIASIDLSLASLFISANKFDQAEKYIGEGTSYSQNKKINFDFQYTNYELEFKRKNFEKALYYLTSIYHQDSLDHMNAVSARIDLLEKKHTQDVQLAQNQVVMERQKNTRYLFWGATTAAVLLTVVIILLVANVKRKAETNNRLTELNAEVSKQKDDLDRINHHLEEIIDERTKDLQTKNKKLSEYSSYLSHQIRGPIATLKGLMNLEKEGLVDKNECIVMMDKCVSEIDEKIIDMSDMLHDPGRTTVSSDNL